MPVEGQWTRTRTPLSRRDKLLLAVFAGALAIAAVVAVIVTSGKPARSDRGCIRITLITTLGGAPTRKCGEVARSFCRDEGDENADYAAACRNAGYAVGRRADG